MVGITSFGAYVPFYRLNRDELARAWGTRSSGGQKAIASYDEDSVTMAVAAVLDCFKGQDIKKVQGLNLATTTSPYKEKQAATIVATAADFPREIQAADIANSIRSGTIAMNFALDAVESGRAKNIVVAASDCRLGVPRGDFESLVGDGAAALINGEVTLSDFTDERVLTRGIQDFIPKVKYVFPAELENASGPRLPGMVTVKLQNGRTFSSKVEIPRGMPGNPMSDEELQAKFRFCAQTVLPAETINRVINLVSNLEQIADIRDLMNLL